MSRRALLPLAAAGLLAAGCFLDKTPAAVKHVRSLASSARADTLHVRPPETAGLPSPYPGKPLDTADYAAFEARYPVLRQRKSDQLFALFEISLDTNRTGFILRVPGAAGSSAAALWVWDKRLGVWELPAPVADALTDSTRTFVEDGWIVDFNGDGRKDVVRRRHSSWLDPETGQTLVTDSLFTSIGTPHGFTRATPNLDSNLREKFEIPGYAPPDAAPVKDSAGGTVARPQSDSITIHQEVDFAASPARVYGALLTSATFTAFSGRPATIDPKTGGQFSLFGGHIIGVNVELVPDARIVQAWRVVDWPAGDYSIVRFELTSKGTGTHLVFDHIGFPAGLREHLAEGWEANYWSLMKKYLK